MALSAQDILEIDKRHVWHPYSRVENDYDLYPVASASGVNLTLATGETLYDGMSSWWSAIHGYNHPELNKAVTTQLEKMSHVMFGGLTHEPAVTLAKTLVDITPPGLDKVFISDSGSVAVEIAMKMALQYWKGRGETRSKFLTLRSGYHGDTFAAMSVCDPKTGMHHIFSDVLAKQLFAPSPTCRFDEPCTDKDFAPLAQLANEHRAHIAGVILEPIVQGTGGMNFYSPEYLSRVRHLCDDLDIPLIADEIATGFGRTGKMFACEHAGISPDIMCLGKSLTGGYMSLAATLCTTHMAETICQGEAGVFMHGPTFMGNPLACATANKSIEMLLEKNWQKNIASLASQLTHGLASLKNLEGVADVRVLGAIGVVELENPVTMTKLQPLFVQNGIWLRPFGKLVYTMPPFISTTDDIAHLCAAIEKVVKEYLQS